MFGIDFNKLRFLICDDNAHMRRILRTLLHSFGAREAYEAEDGATALEMYIHYVPDIMILDWSMPIFDGLELAQMIRQPDGNGNPYTPIIMLTGHSDKRRVMMARDAGVTEFLAKPISAKALYQRIVNVVVSPRPFIKTKSYFGPDRRRNTTTAYIGPERRNGGKAEVIQQQALLDKARTDDLTRSEGNCIDGRPRARQDRRQDRGRDLCRLSGHPPAEPAAARGQACCRGDRRRSGRARGKGAGGTVERVRRLDAQGVRSAGRGACRAILSVGLNQTTQDELFRAAHDIKGDAATFGYPLAAAAADSLCRIMEHAPDFTKVPNDLIAHHVNAIQAIVREHKRLGVASVAGELSKKLRGVADEYLTAVNQDRPEHLEVILGPSIVPGEASLRASVRANPESDTASSDPALQFARSAAPDGAYAAIR